MNSIYYERNRNKLFLMFLVITLVLLFQDVLQKYFPPFKWADEVIGFTLIPLTFILLIAKQVKLYKEEKIIIAAFVFFILIGVCSSFISKYQGLTATISDLIIVSKFIGAYFFSRVFFNDINVKEYFKYIKAAFRAITFIIFCLTVIDIVFNIFPKEGRRFFIYSEQLLFYHPTYLAVFCVVILAYLTLVYENKPGDYIFIIQIILVCISTFRAKALGFLLIYAVSVPLIRKIKKIKISYIILVGALVLFIFSPQISAYYIENQDSPRNILTVTSFKIANEFFPIGAGFGTYASSTSAVNYSPLYYVYGINNVWGLQKEYNFFISDTFWPMIVGQFGYLGAFLFLLILFNFFMLIKRLLDLNINYLFFAMIPFAYLLVSSTSESSFVNFYSVNFSIMMGIAVNQIKFIFNENIKSKSTGDEQHEKYLVNSI